MIIDVILFFIPILLYDVFYRVGLTILLTSYTWFDNLSLAIVFYIVVFNLVLLPLKLWKTKYERQAKYLEKRLEQVEKIPDPKVRNEEKKALSKNNKPAFRITLFYYVFWLVNLLASASILHSEFKNRNSHVWYTPWQRDVPLAQYIPQDSDIAFPINSVSWLPFLGVTDLNKPNHEQNIVTAIATLLYGIIHVLTNRKKSDKRDFLMHIVVFPVAGFLIPYMLKVACGFEFSIVISQIVAVLMSLILLGLRKVMAPKT
ncbi:MAG: hypothetical protein WCP97_04740 [bacterium]